MPRGPDLALQEDRPVAERRRGLGRSGGQRGRQVGGASHPAHPPSPAAGRRLDQQRVADPVGLGDDRGHLVGAVDRHRIEGPGHALDPDRSRDPAGPDLVPERLDDGRRRPDEDEPGVLDRPGEGRPLGQEAIAGMDGVGTGRKGRLDHQVDPQVALGRWWRPEPDGEIGLADVHRTGVGVAVHGDRLHAHLVAGADDPDGDLPAVGDQDPTEGCCRSGHRPAASLHKDSPTRAPSEGDVAMLLSRVRVALVRQHLEGADETRPGLGRADDVVDVAPRSGDERVRKSQPVLGDESGAFGAPGRRPLRSLRGR